MAAKQRVGAVHLTLSMPDARQLLALLETSGTFPDVIEALRAAVLEAQA